jgi:hypothetical protein
MPTREQLLTDLVKQQELIRQQIGFLTDSDVFYQLNLGTASKTVQVIDFSTSDGKKFLTTDNDKKLTQDWYENYAGFLTSEDAVFDFAFSKLKAWLKMYRIHTYLYPSGYPYTNPVNLDEFRWVIKYDTTDSDSANWNFIAYDLTAYPQLRDDQFYFNSEADCNQAITWMRESSTTNTYDENQSLKDFFGITY